MKKKAILILMTFISLILSLESSGVSGVTSLSLNQEVTDNIKESSYEDYVINLGAGDYVVYVHIEYTYALDAEIKVATDISFTNVIESVNSFGQGGAERCFFSLTSSKTIYIRVSALVNTGWIQITVSNNLLIGYGILNIGSLYESQTISANEGRFYCINGAPQNDYKVTVTNSWSLKITLSISFDLTWENVYSYQTGYSSVIIIAYSGEYDRIFVRVDSDNNGFFEIIGTLEAEYNDPPVLSSPDDITYEYGVTGKSISWTVTDIKTDNPWYKIYKDGGQEQTGDWSNGDIISINIEGLAINTYNYTVELSDGIAGAISDEVSVNVINDIPQITHPLDLIYDVGSTNNSIEWIISDLGINNSNYTIYRDGQVNRTGSWTSGESIPVDVDGMAIGSYTFSIEAFDGLGGSVSDDVTVVVENFLPTIFTSSNLEYEVTLTNHSIFWTITDDSIDNANYSIYCNGIIIKQPESWVSGQTISLNVDDLEVGVYNYSLVVLDGLGGSEQADIQISVFNKDPLIFGSYDFSFEVATPPPSPVSWTITDLSTDITSYNITRNGSLLESGTWMSGSEISWEIGTLSIGTYYYVIKASDGFGGFIEDVVTISVFNGQPILSQPSDISYRETAIGYYIHWNITDSSVSDAQYNITRDGTSLISGKSWSTDTMIWMNVSGLSIGTYTYVIVASDGFGGYVEDEVIVQVTETITSKDLTITSPPDVSYEFGTSGKVLTWVATDESTPNPKYLIYIVMDNGTQKLLVQGSWISGEPITFNTNVLPRGKYKFRIVVYDGNGYYAMDEVMVSVIGKTSSTPPEPTVSDSTPGLNSWITLSSFLFIAFFTIRRKRTQ